MEEFMQSIATSLRNFGCIDAESGYDYVRVRGCEFYATNHRRGGFWFLGRHYKSGNTIKAIMDLLQEFPERLRQRDEALHHQSNERAAKALTKKLDDPDMRVTYTYGKFVFTYSCTDLSNVAQVAERMATEMAAAAEQAWNEILSSPRPNTYVKFTSEGGFSLN